MSTRAGDSAYALLTDGTTIEIRPAQPGDFDAVREMYIRMSPDNLYLRFFSMGTSNAPVSISSYSGWYRSRRALVSCRM